MSYDTPDFVTRPAGGSNPAFARFYMKPCKNEFRSQAENRPIFEEMEYVEITLPGDRRSIVDRRVKPDDLREWPAQYKAFKENLEQLGEGMPLGEWAPMTRSQVEEYKFFKVHTVEQMAAISDGALMDLPMGTRELRDHAQRFLAQAAGGKPTEALAAEVAKRDDTIEELRNQVTALKAENEKLKKGNKGDGA